MKFDVETLKKNNGEKVVEYRYVKPVLDEKPQVVNSVASGSEDVDLSKRTLADDILDSAFKTKLEELLA